VCDALTVYAGSARDLLLAYLILGGDVDWPPNLIASGCTARLEAGSGQGAITHFYIIITRTVAVFPCHIFPDAVAICYQ